MKLFTILAATLLDTAFAHNKRDSSTIAQLTLTENDDCSEGSTIDIINGLCFIVTNNYFVLSEFTDDPVNPNSGCVAYAYQDFECQSPTILIDVNTCYPGIPTLTEMHED